MTLMCLGCPGRQSQFLKSHPPLGYPVLVRGRPVSCHAVYVTQVVHVPYVVEQDEDGIWCEALAEVVGMGQA